MDHIVAVCFDGACNAEIALKMDCALAIHLTKGKCVGIFGLGLSGQGAALLCEKLELPYEVVDEYKGDSHEPHFAHYGFCVFSPGFSRRHPWWIQAEALVIPCYTEIDFAASCLKNKVIAVTGTNGKTSTVEMVTQLLRSTRKSALAVGNNGYVLSKAVAEERLPEDGWFVCEISSFQAEALKLLRPICTLFTNIAPDHLLYHGSFENYLAAKKNLLNLTAGPIICGNALRSYLQEFPNVHFAEPLEQLQDWLTQFPYSYSFGQRENFVLLRAFAEQFQISLDLLVTCLMRFAQPPHRLYCCYKWNGIEFWNDSKGTNLHAVQAALESFKNKTQVYWILGGKSKGEDVALFAETFNRYPNVTRIYLVGETGPALYDFRHQFHAETILCDDLDTVFKQFIAYVALPLNEASAHSEKASARPHYLVLSPGFSSLDQFKSFEQRGEAFERLAREMKEERKA